MRTAKKKKKKKSRKTVLHSVVIHVKVAKRGELEHKFARKFREAVVGQIQEPDNG
jgi:hypothetical protein